MTRFLLLVGLGAATGAGQPAWAQRGCTDPQATNFNAGAIVNDGSCQYAATMVALTTKATLPNEVAETSGLQVTPQGLWTMNDSGNPPVLYRLDPATGMVSQRVRIRNFGNVDWEDLTADARYLYVADFGNNNGDRHDLRVLRVRQSDLGPAAETVDAEAISFTYPDQTSFAVNYNHHNFDCEALFYANDSLHLFTKHWADLQTSYYTIPAAPGTYVAHLKSRFNVNGLITAASLNATGTEACLLGYNSSTGATFLWLFYDFPNNQFLRGNKRRLELPNALQIGQAEGVSFFNRYQIYLSNERIANIITIPPRLYEFNISPWVVNALSLAASAGQVSKGLQVFPNPAPVGQTLTVRQPGGLPTKLLISLQDLLGRTVFSAVYAIAGGTSEQNINLAAPAGVYVLKITSSTGNSFRKLVIQ